MKTYPLTIENWGADTYIVGTKGHHNPHEFMKKVRDEGYNWPLGHPSHEWLKAVPDGSGNGVLYASSSETTRGAFPATVAREAYGEDAYREADENR